MKLRHSPSLLAFLSLFALSGPVAPPPRQTQVQVEPRRRRAVSGVAFTTLEATEDQHARQEVHDFAVETFLQQRQDRQEVRRRAQEAPCPLERARCREAVLTSPEPSLDACLDLSRKIRRKREVDNPSTIVAP